MKGSRLRCEASTLTASATLLALVMAVAPSGALAESAHAKIQISNVATKISDNQWRWTAYVAGPENDIGNIRCVVYRLHPTFPNPVQRVCQTADPKYPFGFTATGWGTFGLLARVEFDDGDTQDVVWRLDFSIPPLR